MKKCVRTVLDVLMGLSTGITASDLEKLREKHYFLDVSGRRVRRAAQSLRGGLLTVALAGRAGSVQAIHPSRV